MGYRHEQTGDGSWHEVIKFALPLKLSRISVIIFILTIFFYHYSDIVFESVFIRGKLKDMPTNLTEHILTGSMNQLASVRIITSNRKLKVKKSVT